jgi:hydroxyacyl-ACP dehydratase HTD2-like protein with hotdog domain
MAIDRAFVGHAFPAFVHRLEAAHLRAFCEAIGERECTRAPLTYMKAIEGGHDSSRAILQALGVDLRRVLHAEQEFDYLLPLRVGDEVRVERRVADIYERRNGAMEFIVIESSLTRCADGKLTGRSRQIVLVRNPTAGAAP